MGMDGYGMAMGYEYLAHTYKKNQVHNVYEELDIEGNATAGTMPVRCP